MNASLQDGYNIGWKLALILKGRAKPELIDTYASERGGTAKQLIDFDRYWSKLFKRKKVRSAFASCKYLRGRRRKEKMRKISMRRLLKLDDILLD